MFLKLDKVAPSNKPSSLLFRSGAKCLLSKMAFISGYLSSVRMYRHSSASSYVQMSACKQWQIHQPAEAQKHFCYFSAHNKIYPFLCYLIQRNNGRSKGESELVRVGEWSPCIHFLPKIKSKCPIHGQSCASDVILIESMKFQPLFIASTN